MELTLHVSHLGVWKKHGGGDGFIQLLLHLRGKKNRSNHVKVRNGWTETTKQEHCTVEIPIMGGNHIKRTLKLTC